jgi:cytoskeletal protein RodZ
MSDSPAPRRSRLRGAAIVAVLVAVIVVVVVIALVTGGARMPAATTTSTPAAPTAAIASATPSAAAAASTRPKPTASSTPKASTSKAPKAPTPQPTKTAAISSPAPIVKALTAEVTKSEAVQGKAEGPGEIAGPAVRFTIAIKNATGKSIDLSNTVVNAYYGSDSTPAVELQEPGGKAFPRSVANGRSATGVFVFNIAKDQRKRVEVTVDTSVRNPVVAFKGSAPR